MDLLCAQNRGKRIYKIYKIFLETLEISYNIMYNIYTIKVTEELL